jgi:polar amino acid transport system substrate-binding protein
MKKVLMGGFLMATLFINLTVAEAKKVLTVGTAFGIIPFVYNDEKNELVGFDIDMAKEIGKEMGYDEVKFEAMNFDGVIPAVMSGKVDLLASALVITKSRAEKVDFSNSYYDNVGSVVAIPAENKKNIRGIKDLKGKKVSVVVGSAQLDYLSNMDGVDYVGYSNVSEAFLALQHGKVDATFNPFVSVKLFLKEQGKDKFKIVGGEVPISGVGFAVKKGNTELLAKINTALKKVIKSGKRDAFAEKHFPKPTEEDKKLLGIQ